MIEVENLVKWYGPTRAVDNLSFSIPKGQIVGFLGPNGAGKSTTLRMLTGYLPPTSGRATIDGFDVHAESNAARSKIGYLPESTPLYPEMRVEEYLHYRGKLMHMDRAARNARIGTVCDRCGLTPVRRRLIGALSKGNRQRVGLAQALLHEPPVLILDEPTAGLDPNQIAHVRTLIAELRGRHTIILSTHILPEIEKTADRVLIIAGGRIVAEGTPDELRQRVPTGSKVVLEVKVAVEQMRAVLQQIPSVHQIDITGHGAWSRAIVTPKPGLEIREELGRAVIAQRWDIREMRHESATLEQFFVNITAQQSVASDPAA